MGRCTGWKIALALIAAPAVLVMGGCGSSKGSAARTRVSASAAAAAAESTTSVVVRGCPAAQPRGIVPSPKEWIVSARVCAASDGSSLLLTNISTVAVLEVRASTPATSLQEQGGGSTESLADQTAARAAPASCSKSACVVPPGHAVLASGSPATIDFGAMSVPTVAVSAARSFATWIQEETPNGPRVAGRIVTCAKLIGGAVTGRTPWVLAYENLYRRGSFCWRLITTVMTYAGTGERPVVQLFQDIARRIDQGAWSDALRYGFAHVAAG